MREDIKGLDLVGLLRLTYHFDGELKFAHQFLILCRNLSQHLFESGLGSGVAIQSQEEGPVSGIELHALDQQIQDPIVAQFQSCQDESNIAGGLFAQLLIQLYEWVDGGLTERK